MDDKSIPVSDIGLSVKKASSLIETACICA